MKAGTGNWIQAQVGMSLEPGDRIRTGGNSSAGITFFEGSTVELQAGTEIEVASLNTSRDTGSATIILEQTIGSIIFRVVKIIDPASRYEVATPDGMVAVRGSAVQVYVSGDGTTRICNLEGDIWAVAQGVELQIPEGECCIIRPDQPPRLEEAPTEVRLGTTLPLTGHFAVFGEQTFGMQKAVDDINAQGGIYLSKWGKRVEVKLIIRDNQSDCAQVQPLGQELVLTDKVHALLSTYGPCGPPNLTSVVANQYGVPQIISSGPFEPWYYGMRAGENWTYTWFSGFAIGEKAAPPRNVPGYTLVETCFMYMDRVNARANTNMIAGVFGSDDPDGIGFYDAFPPLMEDYGMTVVGVNESLGLFPMDFPQDFTSIIQAWKNAGVEIIWANCPGGFLGMLLSQCYETGFRPKIVMAARAALLPVDVINWGAEPPLGWGVGTEVWWSPHYAATDGFVGIGNRTAASLAEDWATEVGEPLNPFIGPAYLAVQVMLDAIERAGDVDGNAINEALGATDLHTIGGWVKFDPVTHFSPQPISFGQWFYDANDKDEPFTLHIVTSAVDFIPVEADPIFPKPW